MIDRNMRVNRLAAVLLVLLSGAGAGLLQAPPVAAHGPLIAAAAPRDVQQTDSKVALVRQAFTLINTNYFNPVDAAAVLNAAWSGAVTAAAGAGNAVPPLSPDTSGDATSSFARFDGAYEQLESATVIDPTALAYATIRGMTRFINNCHTGFLTPAQAAMRRAIVSGDALVGPGFLRQT